MSKPGSCPDCHGKGWIELACGSDEASQVCGLCHGSGATSTGRTCNGCAGTGRIEVRTGERQSCLKCLGTGHFPLAEEL
ncbi:MAG TPA: hypothetical protein VLW17_07350 [Thermoanaerobaculaceae bacterium]|nr:hypothetical protein [Thermoanaerobaculaceae bacterium]